MRMVIAGAGETGGSVAVGLRDEGFDGDITLVGDEPGPPFGRPPLSKTYLRGEEDLSGWFVRPADWYREHDVSRVEGRAVRVDTRAHALVLANGESISYD